METEGHLKLIGCISNTYNFGQQILNKGLRIAQLDKTATCPQKECQTSIYLK